MYIFCVGTWAEGYSHFEKFKTWIEQSESASLRASVFRLPVGFPVLVEGGLQSVPGTLLKLKESDTTMKWMDEFHGIHPTDPIKGIHYRKTVSVMTESHNDLEAEVYFYNPHKLSQRCAEIRDGNWMKNMGEFPSMVSRVSDTQKEYIVKLGKSRGRDIVPIKLGLYRELMSLELIVDKGRRLALSPLGKELFRYLA